MILSLAVSGLALVDESILRRAEETVLLDLGGTHSNSFTSDYGRFRYEVSYRLEGDQEKRKEGNFLVETIEHKK